MAWSRNRIMHHDQLADQQTIAGMLRETGLLLNAKGENKFKAKAYLSAARTVAKTQEDLTELIKEERLTDLPGIGESIARYITEISTTGGSQYLTKLRDELPEGAAELSQVQGLTLKRIQALNEQLDITTIDELELACKEGKLAPLKGFGIKLQNDILQSLAALKDEQDQIRLGRAYEIAEGLAKQLGTSLKTKKIEIAGAIRRWHESVNKLTLVVEADSPSVLKALKNIRTVLSVEERGDCLLALLADGISAEIFPVGSLALGLVEHTGTDAHFGLVKAKAEQRGFIFSDDRVLKNGKEVNFKTEEQVFEKFGLSYVPPELREGTDEVALAENSDFSDLVDANDIIGMTHCHSTYSDGGNTIEQMARAAQKLKMQYITITDHSPTAHYAGGVDIERLKQQWEEIDRVQEKLKIRILKGTECDILSDGRLDYPDHILEKFDVIIASIHSRYRQNEEAMTKRLLAGLRNPHFKIWGHPLGRIILNRDPIPCDVQKVLEAIADARVAIEINGDPYRLDLAPKLVASCKRTRTEICYFDGCSLNLRLWQSDLRCSYGSSRGH